MKVIAIIIAIMILTVPLSVSSMDSCVELADEGHYEEAIECHDKAIEINPRNDMEWNNKALALVELDRYAEAIECFNKAIEINPKNDLAWYNKGLALRELDRYKEAIDCIYRAIQINPEAYPK